MSRAFPSFQRSTRNRTCACACMRLQVCRRWKDRITVCNPPRLCSSHLRMCSSLIVVMTAVRTVHATTHQPCSLPRGRPLRRPLPEASTCLRSARLRTLTHQPCSLPCGRPLRRPLPGLRTPAHPHQALPCSVWSTARGFLGGGDCPPPADGTGFLPQGLQLFTVLPPPSNDYHFLFVIDAAG